MNPATCWIRTARHNSTIALAVDEPLFDLALGISAGLKETLSAYMRSGVLPVAPYYLVVIRLQEALSVQLGKQPGSERLALRMQRWAAEVMGKSRCRYYRRSFGDVSISSAMAVA